MADRTDFLLEMYKQMCSEMDRHIKATWQIVGVLLSTFAVFVLVEKDVISPNIAAAIIIAVCELTVAIIIEANFWYNRNLVIVANIERQFLTGQDDAKEIHYYFLKHRTGNAYLDMMKMQVIFVLIILFIVLAYHFGDVILPTFSFKNSFDFSKTIPYVVLIGGGIFLIVFHYKRKKNYNEFKTNSPGKDMTALIANYNLPSNSDHVTS